MQNIYENPANGYREVGDTPYSWFWCLCFGFFYLLYKGAWKGAIIGVVAAICTWGLSWFIMPLFARSLVASAYQQRGWRLVRDGGTPGTLLSRAEGAISERGEEVKGWARSSRSSSASLNPTWPTTPAQPAPTPRLENPEDDRSASPWGLGIVGAFVALIVGVAVYDNRSKQETFPHVPKFATVVRAQAPELTGNVQVTVALEGDGKPLVVGTTNLPDGTSLTVTLFRKASSYNGQAKTTVVGGKFRAGPFSRKGSKLNPGKYTVLISSPLGTFQPPSVQAVIGRKGEKLRGPATKPAIIAGERVVEFRQVVSIGGKPSPAQDTKAREQAKVDLKKRQAQACLNACNTSLVPASELQRERCHRRCRAKNK